MTETAKTICFLAVGLVAIGIGLATRPSTADFDVSTRINTDLTKDFTSVDDAKRLRIVRFDEDTATLEEFEVAEVDGLWSIPSKDGYPADGSQQMAEAATSLMDRKILRIEGQNASDHEQFGVIDPLSPKLEVGQKGVGTRVTMSDNENKPLVDLIVGKAVKDAEGQRYVREAGRDVVYVIEIDPTKLSTNFEDWIERDLLKLNPWDLKRVEIKDYSAELIPAMTPDGRLAIQVAWDPRAEMALGYDETKGEWTAERLAQFDPATEQQAEFSLAEGEELNTKALNALKDALDDLEIVDVVRKPQGLSDDLKAGGDFLNDAEAQRDLMRKGFVTASAAGSGNDDIISSDGEVIATLKDGTEYVLRFGDMANVSGGGDADSESEGPLDAGADETTSANDVHRYLFVMARFNEDAVERPELEDLPELPAGAYGAGEKTGEATEDSSPKGEGDASAVESAAGESAGVPASEENAEQSQPGAEETAETADAAAKTGAASGEAENESAEVDSGEPAADESAAADNAAGEKSAESDDSAGEAAEEGAASPEVDKMIAERKRIETENQRKLDDYQATLTKGRNNVKELNERFGDWYFVVANETFNKVRLGKNDVIQKADSPETGDVPGGALGVPGSPIHGLPPIPGAE